MSLAAVFGLSLFTLYSFSLSRVWQHVNLPDVSLGTRPRYSLVADEDVKKPTNQTKPNQTIFSQGKWRNIFTSLSTWLLQASMIISLGELYDLNARSMLMAEKYPVCVPWWENEHGKLPRRDLTFTYSSN